MVEPKYDDSFLVGCGLLVIAVVAGIFSFWLDDTITRQRIRDELQRHEREVKVR